MGTPAYMSPEQTSGAPDIDVRTDIFSLALLIYRMLGGSLPLGRTGSRPLEQVIERATMRSAPPPLRAPRLGGALPLGVDGALQRAREPDRARRTPSAQRFLMELGQAA